MRIEAARQEALATGAKKYSTGKPCKHGHNGPRYTATAHCVICHLRASVLSARKHAERVRATARACYARNPGKDLAKQARRRARKLNQICVCCMPADFGAIYWAGSLLGREVDHVLPLIDGGLHCCKNLQLLTPAEHRAKTAKENRARG
jgi:5-methylcytosine-specific restriction endonuclease McrA